MTSWERMSRLAARVLDAGREVAEMRKVQGDAEDLAFAALELAYKDKSDESLRDELAVRSGRDARCGEKAIGILARGRTSFVSDRAYRLLVAAVSDRGVEPIDASVRELFDEEERLGRLPLGEAYARLAESEPRLREVEARVRQEEWSGGYEDPAHHLPTFVREAVEELVGVRARRGGVLATDLANSLVQLYLLIVGGLSGYGDTVTPLFGERPRAEITSVTPRRRQRSEG